MAETSQDSQRQSKELVVAKNTLITPSASPPPSGTTRAKSARPPLKRTRINSFTSLEPSSRASSSSSRPIDPHVDEAWRASSKRLVDVWDSLAERYNVPLDQDDIIDLRTVELVKDRGVVRGLKKGFDIGVFGAPQHDEDYGGASSEDGAGTEVDERDEEIDEIDSFAQEPTVPVKIEMERWTRYVPPFRAANPDDANDLKEFLAAEEKRRARDGEDDESDGYELLAIISTSEEEDAEEDISRSATASHPQRRPGTHFSPVLSRPIPIFQRVITKDALTVADEDSSEDELAAWSDDATPARSPPQAYSDEGASGHRSPSPASSCSTSGNVLRGSSKPTASSKSGQGSLPRRPRNIQLQTPPLSHTASSVSTETPEIRSSPFVPSTAVARPSLYPRARSSPIASSSRTVSRPSPTRKRAKTPSVPNHIVEVIVSSKPMARSSSVRPSQRQSPHGPIGSAVAREVLQPGIPSVVGDVTGKGKAKETRQILALRDISDDELPPPPKFKSASTLPFNDISDSELPSPVKRASTPHKPAQRESAKPQRRKRKRSSTSTALQTSPEQSPTMSGRARRSVSVSNRGKIRQATDLEDQTSSDHSEPQPATRTRGRQQTAPSISRSSTRSSTRSSMPPPPLPYPPIYPSYPSTHDPAASQRYLPPPPLPPLPDPQAQYGFMQAVQYLSYYLSGSANQPPPPPNPYSYPQGLPQTPRHHSRARTRDPSSSPPRFSSPDASAGYPTPGRRASRSYDVGYSSGTSPPMSSSPIPSSPTTTYHPAPAMPKRSKSRGRRVSFKLDSDDERHPWYERRDEHVATEKKGSDKTVHHSHRAPQKPRPNRRHSNVHEDSSEEDSSSWRRTERGRTPGPSSGGASRSNSVR